MTLTQTEALALARKFSAVVADEKRAETARRWFRESVVAAKGELTDADLLFKVRCHLESKTIGAGILAAQFSGEAAKYDDAFRASLGMESAKRGRKPTDLSVGNVLAIECHFPKELSAEQIARLTPRASVPQVKGTRGVVAVVLPDGVTLCVAHAGDVDAAKARAAALASALAGKPAEAAEAAEAPKPSKRKN